MAAGGLHKIDRAKYDTTWKRIQQKTAELTNLSMREVQDTVKLRPGATVSLSACNTGRGEINPEGVVGLARAFLVAGAAATVVSLWSVDDGSTAALMEHVYMPSPFFAASSPPPPAPSSEASSSGSSPATRLRIDSNPPHAPNRLLLRM